MLKRMDGNELNRADGQAMVEFALALPVVLLLIFGVLQFGRAFQIKILLENAAREGAYYFIYNRDDQNSGFSETKTVVMDESADPLDSANPGVEIAEEDIDVYCIDDFGVEITTGTLCPVDSTVVVHITHAFPISVFGYVLDDLEMETEARMLVP